MRATKAMVWIAVLLAAALVPAVAIILVPLVVARAAVSVRAVARHATPERVGLARLLACISAAHLPRASLVA